MLKFPYKIELENSGSRTVKCTGSEEVLHQTSLMFGQLAKMIKG